jgi:hypothetical protein
MKLRVTLISVLAALAALLTVAPAIQALSVNFEVTAAKKADGNYTDGIQSANVSQGKTKLFFWRVESTSLNDQPISFDDAATADSGGEDYRIKWYKGKKPKGSKDISHDVQTAGFNFTLKAGKRKHFTAEVTPKAGAGTLCLGGQASNMGSDSAYFEVNGICN